MICPMRIAASPIPNHQGAFALRATAGWRSLSLWRSERLLDVLRNRIDHRAFVVTLFCLKEPAVNERVDLGAAKLDHKTAKAGPPSRAATTHSLCGGFSCNNGFCRYVVY